MTEQIRTPHGTTDSGTIPRSDPGMAEVAGMGAGTFTPTTTDAQAKGKALKKLGELKTAIEQERVRLDTSKFDVFLKRTPGVHVEFATAALDEMFEWYDEYVVQRHALDHYLDALAVVTTWAQDPTQPPAPLPEATSDATAGSGAPVTSHTTSPMPTTAPARPMPSGAVAAPAFGARVAEMEQLRAELRRDVADVLPAALDRELDARLPILAERVRSMAAAAPYTPVGSPYTPASNVPGAAKEIEQPVASATGRGDSAPTAGETRGEPHAEPNAAGGRRGQRR